MEQEIILEGIHAMLEEIRDNMKRNPELEMINSKLVAIEQVCNEFTGQKFVTEEVMAQFLACTLQRIIEMNEKQDEKMRRYISVYHKYKEEQFAKQQEELNVGQRKIENLLMEIKENQGIFSRFRQWIRQFGI